MELPKNIIQKPMYSTDKNLTDGWFWFFIQVAILLRLSIRQSIHKLNNLRINNLLKCKSIKKIISSRFLANMNFVGIDQLNLV